MGSEVVADSASREGGEGNLAPVSYTQIFESYLPFYLSAGMTWDEFLESARAVGSAAAAYHELAQHHPQAENQHEECAVVYH